MTHRAKTTRGPARRTSPGISPARPPGRPENPIPFPDGALGRLAQCLREGRTLRGLTYADLGRRTGYHPTTLQRAAAGERLPTRQVAMAYGRACGRSATLVGRLWQEAWAEARRRSRRRPGAAEAPKPDLVRDFADLAAAMVAEHERHGAPPVRVMELRAEARAKEYGTLSRSTAQRLLSRQKTPSSREQLQAFLFACGVPSSEWRPWMEAWRRALQNLDLERRTEPTVTQLETPFADESGRVSSRRAIALARTAGFKPLEAYQGFGTPWTVRCSSCGSAQRVRLSDLLYGGSCISCGKSGERVTFVVDGPSIVCGSC